MSESVHMAADRPDGSWGSVAFLVEQHSRVVLCRICHACSLDLTLEVNRHDKHPSLAERRELPKRASAVSESIWAPPLCEQLPKMVSAVREFIGAPPLCEQLPKIASAVSEFIRGTTAV